MGKVIVEAEVSLDGVMGGEMDFWQQIFQFHTPDVQEYLDNLLLMPDALFLASLTTPISALSNFSGFLDINGQAQASIAIPSSPSLIGASATVAFVTVNFTTGLIEGISNGAAFTVGP